VALGLVGGWVADALLGDPARGHPVADFGRAAEQGVEISDRVRRPGGGRKRLSVKDRTLLADLEALVDPETRGDPSSPLRWTAKSTR
jgi:hypothetical protein